MGNCNKSGNLVGVFLENMSTYFLKAVDRVTFCLVAP